MVQDMQIFQSNRGFFPFRPFYSDTGYAERIVDALLRADSAAGAAFDTDHPINDMKHLLFSRMASTGQILTQAPQPLQDSMIL